jgi:hypothetical protein
MSIMERRFQSTLAWVQRCGGEWPGFEARQLMSWRQSHFLFQMRKELLRRSKFFPNLYQKYGAATWFDTTVQGDFYCADPLGTIEFYRTLTPNVLFCNDYIPHDFTVFMRKDPLTS